MDKKKLKTNIDKHLANLKILFSMESLQEMVKQIRNKLEIPIDMYSDDVSKEDRNKLCEIWTQDMHRVTGEILSENSPDLSKIPFNYLNESVKKIIREYHLNPYYKKTILHYILYGDFIRSSGQNTQALAWDE